MIDYLMDELRNGAKEQKVETSELKADVQGLKQAINSSSESNKTLLECVVSIKNQMDKQSEKLAWLETQLTQRAIPAK